MVFYKDSFFEWSDKKHNENILKHGVNFYEAMTVFDDDNAFYSKDVEHSDAEDRFKILGISANHRILIVCHCYRESETVIRIISARKATPSEEKNYERQF